MPPENLFGDSLSNSFIVYNFKVEVKVFIIFARKIYSYIKKSLWRISDRETKKQKKDAGDGTWTHTILLPQAPEACASANSATPASSIKFVLSQAQDIYYTILQEMSTLIFKVFKKINAILFPDIFRRFFRVFRPCSFLIKWQKHPRIKSVYIPIIIRKCQIHKPHFCSEIPVYYYPVFGLSNFLKYNREKTRKKGWKTPDVVIHFLQFGENLGNH